MTFDAFAAIGQPGAPATVHNVRLIDAQPAESGHKLLTVEHAGTTRELISPGPWSEEFSRRDVGKFGYVVPALGYCHEDPASACVFYAYIDQSLRRVPELDSHDRTLSDDGRALEVIGWRCDTKPQGFRAPVGIIPGADGAFVPDETVAITLRVPPEFLRECKRVQMTPQALLRSFVGDLAGIASYINTPRADGYDSNGSDERDRAQEWLYRAHAGNMINLDELENREYEEEERQSQRDDFAALLDDFEDYGGKADDLFVAVQALVNKQAVSERP